jgi:hypothetical protein
MKKNHIIIFAIFLAILGVFSSCEKKCCETYKREGLSFNLPNYWKIGEIDSTDANFFFMAIEKKGYGASANAFIEWNIGKIPLDSVMNITQQGYFNEKVFLQGGIEFTKPKLEKYGRFNALTSVFSVELLDVYHIGKIHCFYIEECNKTVMVAYQEVEADASKQRADFEIIENSFDCK